MTSRKTSQFCAEGRFGVAAHRDDVDLKTRDRRQNPQHFFRLAAGAQGEDDVAIGHHAEIAVQRVERIEHDRGRTGAGEGGGDFSADVSGFPDPEDDDLAARFDRFFDQLDRAGEVFIQPLPRSRWSSKISISSTRPAFSR